MASRPLIILAAALVAAGCASGTPPAPTYRTLVVDDQGALKTTTLPAAKLTVAAPLATVWNALGLAYDAIGVELTLVDPPAHRAGSVSFIRRGTMNGEPVSHFANCGSGMTGPIADARRVYFSAITTATAVDATHTQLMTDVHAFAVDVSGSSNDRVECGSTGALEQLLYKALEQRLGTH